MSRERIGIIFYNFKKIFFIFCTKKTHLKVRKGHISDLILKKKNKVYYAIL